MDNSSSMSKMAGRAGSLIALVGILLFFLGIFGAPRVLAFTGVALLAVSLIAFFIEEFGSGEKYPSSRETNPRVI